ncbi:MULTISPECIES: flavodoxin domain-containing protein [unclassified Butyrivibrio]|nr:MULTISPECIES: flavodoxin domain-containing protein [unclassified Butyrivibrio]
MKTLIIYTSQTGFTKKYAIWLADRAGEEKAV